MNSFLKGIIIGAILMICFLLFLGCLMLVGESLIFFGVDKGLAALGSVTITTVLVFGIGNYIAESYL